MNLSEATKGWYDKGFNVVAIRYEIKEGEIKKTPFVEWGQWQVRRQLREEFENQPWENADGFAIVCSYPNEEGLYLSTIDYDVKKVSEEAKKKGAQLFAHFPATRLEQSVSGGQHKVYLSKVKPQTVRNFHASHALELIATGSLCVMAPSKGYKLLNDNPLTIVEDAEELFYRVLGLSDPRERRGGVSDPLLQSWLNEVMQHLNVVGEGPNYFYIRCPFHPPDKHPSFALHKSKFYAIDFHDGRIYSLKELANALSVELVGDLSVAFDRYILRVKGLNLIVYNEGKPLYATPLRSITSKRVKKELAEYLDVDSKSLEQAIAQLIDRVSDSKETSPKTASSKGALWRRVLYADLELD
jgi:hypothetical protein